METHIGLLDMIGVNEIDPLLISFIIITTKKSVYCILPDSVIGHKILFLPNKNYTVRVSGETNSQDQFVVTEFKIKNPDNTINKLGL